MTEPSFGDVTAEYLALRREAGVVETGRPLIWVGGGDAVSFLQGLITVDLDRLSPGEVGRSLLLTPNGRLTATMWALRGRDRVGLVTDPGRGEAAELLRRFRIRVKAEITDGGELVELVGPEAPQVLSRAGLAVPQGWESGPALVARAPLGDLPRFLVDAPASDLEKAGARRVGELAHTAVRVEAGEPLMDRDLDETSTPHESGLVDSAVSLEKGCFLGYELVERIQSRGRVVRSLRGVEIRENVLPPPGAEAKDQSGRTIGTISSVAESLTLRAPVALGVMRTDVESGSEISIEWSGGSVRAVVRDLPLDRFAEVEAGTGS